MEYQRDHSVVTRWGGRSERYREFPRTENRVHDTFGVQPVQFGHAFHYEGWVLERFEPSTKSITPKPTTVTAFIDGVVRCTKATFVVTRRDDSIEFFLVTQSDAPTAALRLLHRIAMANGARAVHWTRADIRARIDEFWWLEKLRQVATIWVRKGAELDQPLLALVAAGRKTLTELSALTDAPKDLIRARLARLHIAGRLIIDRTGGELGATAVAEGMQ